MEKVVSEFIKKLDTLLPFYYYTGNDRFYEEEMPSFNAPRIKPKCDRLPRGELMAADTVRCTSFPVRGTLSVRAKFHANPVCMPPMATATAIDQILVEHSYQSVIITYKLLYCLENAAFSNRDHVSSLYMRKLGFNYRHNEYSLHQNVLWLFKHTLLHGPFFLIVIPQYHPGLLRLQ